jgi:hypothetical protein
MKSNFRIILLVFLLVIKYSGGYSQNTENAGNQEKKILDSISARGLIHKTNNERPVISLTREQALRYLQRTYRMYNWNNPEDRFRQAIGQLIYFAANTPYDSTKNFLDKYAYDSINIPWEKFYVWDTLKLKVPVIPALQFTMPRDSGAKVDTLHKNYAGDSLNHIISTNKPSILLKSPNSTVHLKDTLVIVAIDTLREVTSTENGFPFRYYKWPYQGDSIKTAINSLMGFLEDRDSSVVKISGSSRAVAKVMLNSRSGKFVRFWLPNEFSDSVTVWIGSVSRNTLGIFLEDGIILRRPTKELKYSDAKLNLKDINSKSLQDLNKNAIKPHYWRLHSESNFIFNQTALSNWVRGGDNSIALTSDITGYADYNNKKLNIFSNNFVRFKYGLLKSGDDPIRKNTDLLETNSKINHKAFGKFDFSAIMLFKTQISKGYNYPNDSVPVSKFLSPAVFIFGFGLDYKPNKTTSINFSPLSYKVTFVTDTGRVPPHIDQTKYGIPLNKKAFHEPGASLMISNEFSPYKTLTIVNRLQLFTNYIHNPQNVDVNWEMIATAKINWFTDVRFNTQLIFDDDTKTPLYYKNKQPVLGPDGKQKKTARIQFKELFGFSFVFRF